MWRIETCTELWCPQTPTGPVYNLKQVKVFMSYNTNRQWHWTNAAIPQPKDKQSMAETPWHFVLWQLLTRQSIDKRWPLVIIFLLRDCAVLPIHLTDWGGAFPGDLPAVVFVKQHLIHQVRLHQVGLRGRLWGPIVVSLQGKGWWRQRDEEKNERD